MNQNKTTKYLKYAIGEIILVVIGILIALQINNWNEDRKSKVSERATLGKFLQDLKSDSIFYQANYKTLRDIDSLHMGLYNLVFNKEDSITLKKPTFIRRALNYNPIAKENDPNIGAKIGDEQIREDIQSYFRSMSFVLEAQEEHENVVFEIRSLLRKQRVHDIKAWFESSMYLSQESELNNQIIKSETLVELSENEDFQQLLFESSVKLHSLEAGLNELIKDNSDLMSVIRNHIKNHD
jgi:hypothetical protein